MKKEVYLVTSIVLGIASVAIGQARPDPKAAITAQRDAMTRLAFMDGAWRGNAWIILPSGERHELTQTERVGSTLDGTIKVIEGRGYEEDGTVGFGALGIISYDQETKSYTMRSYAQGQVGDFVITPTEDGFTWEIPAGPVTMRYSATVKEETWHEVGERLMPAKDPVRFFEMTLTRIGDTDWPSSGAIPCK